MKTDAQGDSQNSSHCRTMDHENGLGSHNMDATISVEAFLRGKRDGETRELYERSLREAFEKYARHKISAEFPAKSLPSSVTSATNDGDCEMLSAKKPRLVCESTKKSLKRDASQMSPSVPSTSRGNQTPFSAVDGVDGVTFQNGFQTMSLIGAAAATPPKQKRYKKRSGVANGYGEDFECKMLTLLFLRLLAAGYEFQLASNMEDAGQFDDIVIKYRKHSNDPWRYVCLQLKYKQKNIIQKAEFLGLNDYSLVKLCASSVSVVSSNNNELDSCDESQFILFTNASVSDCLFDVSVSDPLLGTGGKVVSFKAGGEVFQGLCECVDFKEALTELRDQLDGLSDNEVGTRIKDALETMQYQNVALTSYKNDLLCTPTLAKLDLLLKKIELVSDKEEYASFLAKLKVYTNQAQELELEAEIKKELAKVWSSGEISEAAVFHELQTKLRSWWQKEDEYLTHDSPLWLGIIKSQTEALSKSTIDRLTKYCAVFVENCLEFFNHSLQIYEFARLFGILHIRVDARTEASSLKVHQALAKFGAWDLNAVHVNMAALLDQENDVLSAWSTRWCPVLVVECDSDIEQEHAERISERILETVSGKYGNKLLVLIAPETHPLNVHLYHAQSYKHFNDNVIWGNLTENTKELFLSTHFVFNGVQSPLALRELLGEDKGFVNKAGLDVVSQFLTGDVVCGKDLDEESEFFVTRRLKESADGKDTIADGAPFVVNSVSDVPSKVVLVVAEPGMGKSTLLTHLAKSAKAEDPSAFVLHIKLNDCTQNLKEIDIERFNKTTAWTFLEQSALCPGNSLEKLLVRILEHKLVVFVDGVDEVCPYYEKQVFKLLSFLRDMKFRQLWVASRPVFKTKLEDELKVRMLNLVAFSEEDQKSFFHKVWMANVPSATPKKCSEATENLLAWLTDSLGKDNPILGVPLMAAMIAETFREQMFSVHHADGEFKKEERVDVVNLYRTFIEKKFDLYIVEKKKIQNRDLAANINDEDNLLKCILQNHRLASLGVLFTQKDVNSMQFDGKKIRKKDLNAYLQEVSDGREKIGIIIQVIKDKPHFIHRSFAEYFAASLLALHFEENIEIIKRITFDPSRKLISEMFHRILAEKHPLHVAVLNRDFKTAKSILSDEPKPSDVNELDAGGRTPLHLAVILSATDPHPDCIRILRFLIEEHIARLDIADKVLCWVPLRYADRLRAWMALNVILENRKHEVERQKDWPTPDPSMMLDAARNASVSVVRYLIEERGGQLNSVGRQGESMIHTAAQGGNVDVLEYLSTKGLSLNVQDLKHNTALRHASPEALQYLLQHGLNLEAVNKRGRTALQDAAQSGDSDAMMAFLDVNVLFNVSVETPKLRRNAYLLYAAFSGNLVSVKKLIEIGAEIDHQDSNGHTALQIAINRKHFEVARWLLQRESKTRDPTLHKACRDGDLAMVSVILSLGAHIDGKSSSSGKTPLIEAAVAGKLDAVKLLLEKGADVKCGDKNGEDSLHHASSKGLEQVASLLLNHGADVDARDNYGETPLQKAWSEGHDQVAALLIRYGSDVNITARNGRSPLHVAPRCNKLKLFELFEKEGANIEKLDDDGRTPLYAASERGDLKVAALLISHGADVNAAAFNGQTPLHIASIRNKLDVAELLLNKGAEVDCRDEKGITPLHYASQFEEDWGAALLLGYEAHVNITDNSGRTPLHYASQQKGELVTGLLLSRGADVNVTDKTGWTPLHFAARAQWENKQLVALLLNNGADVNVRDSRGQTPLSLATKWGHKEVVEMLETAGGPV